MTNRTATVSAELWQQLINLGTGELKHLYRGICPDDVEGRDTRDDECEACIALSQAQLALSAARESSTQGLYELRCAMAEQGWDSEDRLTGEGWGGTYGYSIWFKRADWHGRRATALVGGFACFHEHTGDPKQALTAAQKAASRALLAWENFPECPPRQGLKGELIARDPFMN